MKKIQLPLIFAFGLAAILLEFRSIKEDAVFGMDMFEGIPLVVLCVLTIVFLYTNSVEFTRTRKYYSFVPVVAGILAIATIFLHKRLRASLDNAPTLFTATNYHLGSDGGVVLDFKKNNHLKAEKRDHWLVTYYWRDYTKHGDSLFLDIPLNFKMGRHAILQGDVLSFTDDTVHFDVYQPLPEP